MCLSIFYSQIIGVYLFLMSIAMLVHQQRYKKTMSEFLTNAAMVAFSGGISLLLGLVIVVTHNIWVGQWPVLITIIGWLLIFQGVMRIFFPEGNAKMMKEMMAQTAFTMISWIWLLVGLFLIWAGFSN